jgi:hypothetical protein
MLRLDTFCHPIGVLINDRYLLRSCSFSIAYAMSVALVDAIGFIYISFQLHAQNTRKCMQCLTQHETLHEISTPTSNQKWEQCDTNVMILIEVGEARCLLQNHGDEDHNY